MTEIHSVTPTKTVEEIAISGQEIPEHYIQKGSDAGTFDASLPSLDIPVIDFGLLNSPSSRSQELEKLRTALCSWGCFQAINHGIEPAFVDNVREVVKQFFALTPEEKQKYSKEDGNEGYGNDDKPTLNWCDRLYLTISPEDQRKLKFWPENPKSFREIVHEYSRKLDVMIREILLKSFARSINLEENCFLDMFGEQPQMLSRFTVYPPCSRPDLVLGLFPHTDGSGLTVLLPDKEVGGLQFVKDNQWYTVPVIPEAFVINVGDQLHLISNGIFKSALHRVVTNPERERISLVVFYCPDPEKELEPVNGAVNEARPRLYKTLKNYNHFFFECHSLGKIAIEEALL